MDTLLQLRMSHSSSGNLSNILSKYEIIISDVDGVLLREGEPIQENIVPLRDLLREGKEIYLMTNNSGISRVLLSRKLSSLGLDISPNRIVTSGVAAAYYLKKNTSVASVFVVGEEGLIEELKGYGFIVEADEVHLRGRPDAVVVGLDRFSTYEKLSRATQLIRAGALFVATNMDRLWPSKEGVKLGAGSIAVSISYALRREPDVVTGKPSHWIVDAMGIGDEIRKRKTLVIGDQLETDVALGKLLNVETLLVLTGISQIEDVNMSKVKPNIVARNLSAL